MICGEVGYGTLPEGMIVAQAPVCQRPSGHEGLHWALFKGHAFCWPDESELEAAKLGDE